ncbi:MAG: prepilin-type N-terminal cleavage/methylation domain-containing protein [bacterium]|nr:prepilin-type N-terminal cleavage/methylation domain-containing protein [bacterium]
MKLQITLKDKNQNGFTLIEVLITMAVISLLFFAGYFVSVDSFSRELIISEHLTLVSVLQKARNRAMNNINTSRHGVYIENDLYIIFRKFPHNSNEPTNEKIQRNNNINISGLNEVIFSQLSGESGNTGDIFLDDGMRTKKITIKKGGLIDW